MLFTLYAKITMKYIYERRFVVGNFITITHLISKQNIFLCTVCTCTYFVHSSEKTTCVQEGVLGTVWLSRWALLIRTFNRTKVPCTRKLFLLKSPSLGLVLLAWTKIHHVIWGFLKFKLSRHIRVFSKQG